MAYYEPKDGDGVLFREREKKSERGPDMTGNLLLDGVTYRLAAWTKEGKGGKFLSLKATVDEGRGGGRRDADEDVPF